MADDPMEHTMTASSLAAVRASTVRATASGYRPGVCNIGPAEVASRRRAGHVGLLATLASFGVLLAIGAPPRARFLVAVPAAGAASGYLQARLTFCAGFGSRGVFNFGPLGDTLQVADQEARGRDRTRAAQIGLASLAVGGVVGVVAALLPR
jgi:hypothetical protein